VSLTEAELEPLKVALAVEPLVESHGVPLTPVQLVAVESQVAPLAPDQVPLVCAEACGVARHTRANELLQVRKSERRNFMAVVFLVGFGLFSFGRWDV
jgi:hypothetical protein